MVLPQLCHKAFGGITLAIIFACAILFHNRLGHQGNHCTHVRMDNRCAQHLVIIRDRPVAVDLVQTRRTVNLFGGKVPRAIERHEVVAIQKRHRFKRFASLELPKDALEQRA